MYFLYILQNKEKNWHYIGITTNITNRISEHDAGEVRSSKSYRPLVLVYRETFPDKTSARKRELFLKKTAKARKVLFEEISKLSSSNGQDASLSRTK